MKKIISWFLTLCILITVFSTGFMFITASAVQSIDGSEVTWSFDDLTKTLTFGGKGEIPDYDDYKDDSGNITIPWSGIDFSNVVFGDEITGIGNFAFYKSLSIESITIPETITKIGKGAFLECKGLRSITIKGNISEIDTQTFSACASLESVSLPSTVTEIGEKAFYKCSSLKTITLPDSVKSIGEAAFNSCILLASFEAPASLETIGDRAFYCCESLKSVTFNSSLTAIGVSAFDGCSKLEAVSIPSGVKTISNAAFSGCEKLTSVELADGIEVIEAQVFNLCTSLKSITVPRTVTEIGEKALGYGKRGALIDGFVITGYEDTSAQTYAEQNEITFNSLGKYIPKSGTIGDSLLWELSDDGVLTFTGSGEIGDYILTDTPEYMLGNPQSILLCDGITSVGANAFLGNYSEITIPEAVTSIGASAFGYYIDENGNAAKTENFTIYGYSDSAAESYAKENGFTFISLNAPTVIEGECGENAKWTYDTDTKTLTISGTGAVKDYALEADGLPEYVIYDISKIVIEDGITSIGNYAFVAGEENGDLTVTVPKSVESIGVQAIGYRLPYTEATDDFPSVAQFKENCTIEGYEGTAAESYADDNSISFVKLESVDLDLSFKISENAEISTIDEENNIITVYNSNTTPEKLLADFVIGADVTVEEFTNVTTGTVIVLKNGDEEIASYKVIVVGDANGDGKINSSDALLILQHSVGTTTLEDESLSAADLSGDGKVNSTDALLVLQISVGQISPISLMPKSGNETTDELNKSDSVE